VILWTHAVGAFYVTVNTRLAKETSNCGQLIADWTGIVHNETLGVTAHTVRLYKVINVYNASRPTRLRVYLRFLWLQFVNKVIQKYDLQCHFQFPLTSQQHQAFLDAVLLKQD